MSWLLFIVNVCLCYTTMTDAFILNSRNCEPLEDPVTFTVYQLSCHYQGPGLYQFSGPRSVQKIKFDRLTGEAHIRINSKSLKQLTITQGTRSTCQYITAPPSVKVFVGSEICISAVCIFEGVTLLNYVAFDFTEVL